MLSVGLDRKGMLLRTARRRSALLLPLVALLALVGCTDSSAVDPTPSASTSSPTPTPTPTAISAQVRAPEQEATVLPSASAQDAALEASRAVFVTAPVVVVAPVADVAAQLTAASAGVALGVPVLVTDAAVDPAPVLAEVTRLEAEAVLAVGAVTLPASVTVVPVAAGADAATLRAVTGVPFGPPTPVAAGQEAAAVRALAAPRPAVLLVEGAPPVPSVATPTSVLPPTRPAAALTGTVALTGVGADPAAAFATVRAAGVPILDAPGGDPRATTPGVQALAAAEPDHVLAFGAGFGPPERLAGRVAAARTGVLLAGGGQLVFPQVPGVQGKKYIALYGTPGSGALGVLGEQDVPATLVRAEAMASPYRSLTADAVVPTVEIIATIASAGPGPDGNYSNERPVDELRPLVEAAGAAGVAVVLDLQPGRTDFVTQAQQYADLLALPHVGLALDPEWRLAPDQVHLRQIGSVGIDEVNSVVAWLADFTAERALPQKMLVLHQFAGRMIGDRGRLDTSRDELALVIHVDGQGTQPAKAGTWSTLRTDAPPVHWGWKNFFDEDAPMLDPVQTYQVQPVPDLVSYQ